MNAVLFELDTDTTAAKVAKPIPVSGDAHLQFVSRSVLICVPALVTKTHCNGSHDVHAAGYARWSVKSPPLDGMPAGTNPSITMSSKY